MARVLTYPATIKLPSSTCKDAHPTKTALCVAVPIKSLASTLGRAAASGIERKSLHESYPSDRKVQLCESRAIPARGKLHLSKGNIANKPTSYMDGMLPRAPDGNLCQLLYLLALWFALLRSGANRFAFILHCINCNWASSWPGDEQSASV